jgi:hypothetical protein
VKRLLIAAAALAFAPVAASAADLSGDWTVSGAFKDMGVNYTLNCTFAVDSGKLSGPCKSDTGDVAATGVTDGTTVEFAYDTTYNGGPVHLDYKGALQSDGSLSGTIDTGGPQGTFTATKQTATK